MQMAVTAAATAADAPACRRSRRSGSSIPCFDYFVHRSGTIDASTIRGKSPGMIQTIANRAWAGLSLQKQQDVVEQAREEELCCPSQTGPDPAQDVPISQIQIARRNSSSNNADASPEPTVEDNAGVAARPGDDNIEAGGIAESMVVDGSAATVKNLAILPVSVFLLPAPPILVDRPRRIWMCCWLRPKRNTKLQRRL